MDPRTIQILFALLRSAIRGTKFTEEERKLYSPELLSDLLKTASAHDVVHLLVLGLKQNGLIAKENSNIEQYIFKAVYRYERLKYEYDNLCAALEEAQIPFLPLKGSVIRKYYPEPWMRTSCDIDILVRENGLQRAVSYLSDNLEYRSESQNSHDVSMFSKSGAHIELHYDLVEDGRANESSKVLKNIWDIVSIRDGYSYWHEMPDEMFYFYHIAHMAKHFENGGCGIRPFIDLDTIMPGMSMYDFADAVRFIANTAVEDEPATSKVFFDTAKFRAFAKGFIGETADSLKPIEISNFVRATFSITIELAARFLDDYITGDRYFRCTYPKHNLVRTRCQLKLAEEIERKWDELEWIVKDIIEKM